MRTMSRRDAHILDDALVFIPVGYSVLVVALRHLVISQNHGRLAEGDDFTYADFEGVR